MIRASRAHPCPICAGCNEDPRGQRKRCAGFVSDDGVWVHCEREEFAGDLALDERMTPPTYLHRIGGSCRCGVEHAPAPLSRNGAASPRRIVATYEYPAADGRTLYRVARLVPKSFFPQHLEPGGTWANGFADDERVLYRLPELLAEPKRVVFAVEGEKDADRLAGLGLLATTNAGGASSWSKHASYTEPLRGRRVVVIPDNDEDGHHWAAVVATSLHAADCTVRVLELSGLPPKGDVSDWLDVGHDVTELKRLIEATAEWAPANAALLVATDKPRRAIPVLDEAAFRGLAGEVVRAIDPHTEADPAAVLVSLLVAFGSAVGDGPHVVVGATHHPAREYVAVVGDTAVARKGESWSPVRRLMARAAPEWADSRVQGGLSSGEGVIASCRDAVEEVDGKTGEQRTTDPGIADKRLLVVEPELARTLRVLKRDGSTLSAILRDAWDSGSLRVMTKAQLRATGTHVCVIGHITETELTRELDESSIGNGFANRFLWIAVSRSKLLPEPEPFDGPLVDRLASKLAAAISFAAGLEAIPRDEEARQVWGRVYPSLTAAKPGLLGAVLSRAEAHAVRLSLIYALLDHSAVIRREHLESALAVVDFAEASARHIFGDRLGDPVADTLFAALADGRELTRNAIRDLFGRHASASRITGALDQLAGRGQVVMESRETGGRPAEVWRRAG